MSTPLSMLTYEHRFVSQYWLWCPIIAPFIGSQVGAVVYDAFLYNGEDSPFNKP
jgi:aquaglyceroporin related protein